MLADTTAPTDRQADDLAKLARTIRKCHATIGRAYDHMRIHSDTALDSAMAAGDALHAAKKKLGHGKWLPWLEKHCGLSECEAQRYMRLAKNREKIEAEIEANPARVTDLSLRGALRLISPPKVIEAAAEPTPTEAVEEPIESSILTGPATHWLEDERGVNKRVSREVFEAAGVAYWQADIAARKAENAELAQELATAKAHIAELEAEPRQVSAEAAQGGSRAPRANAFDPVAWWSEHSVDERRTFLEGIKLEGLLEALPSDWKRPLVLRALSCLAATLKSEKAKPAIKTIQKLAEDAKLLAMEPAGSA